MKTLRVFGLFAVIFCILNVAAVDVTPVVSYGFESSTLIDDSSDYAATLQGKASIIVMNDGNHVLYTDTGYLDLGTTMAKAVAAKLTGNYSISVDICAMPVNSLSKYCWVYSLSNGTTQYLGMINTAGNGNWYYEIKNSSTSNIKSGIGLKTNIWHNICVTQSGTTCSVYIDGILKSTGSVSLSPSSFASNITAAYLGKSPFSADALMTNCLIDNFRIYNSALSAADITSIYSKTSALSTSTSADINTDIAYRWEKVGNPVVTHKYTCDPAAMVYRDTLFIFTGQDAAGGLSSYKIKNWCCFATTDMKHFWEYATPLYASDFQWNTGDYAYAGQVIERNGKFYWYVSTNTSGIGVAVADRPEGPYHDALGKAMLTNSNCAGKTHSWRCIDPTVFIDDDGQAWLFWGNGACWCCKLNEDMISYDTSYGVKTVSVNGDMDFVYTEAPWIHKYKGMYYLSFAAGFPERIEYAISDKPEGPYTYKGILNEIAGNSNTNHQAILQFKKGWYFIYHNGGIQTDGGSYSRSLCIDTLKWSDDDLYQRVNMTTEGVNMISSPDLSKIESLSSSSEAAPFHFDTNGNLVQKLSNRYQIVDVNGKIVKTGESKNISLFSFKKGIYIISDGHNSWKFTK